ncbi:MAG: hypothetical protein P1V97_29220, partial [Planctomycetota bacterium]|nr:hypothetical protein [Planctomycetota bacterium]
VEFGSEVYLQPRLRGDRKNIELEWESTFIREVDSEDRQVPRAMGSSGIEMPQASSNSQRQRLVLPINSTILITDYQVPVMREKALPLFNPLPIVSPLFKSPKLEMLGEIPTVKQRFRSPTNQRESDLQRVVLLTFRLSK